MTRRGFWIDLVAAVAACAGWAWARGSAGVKIREAKGKPKAGESASLA